ncbi:MAG: hypothetical protein JST92_22865, partial [Deltaproteobacteria bacterium]|nr:hypothetical protein [Deltaproteobacteria bacterium]
MLLAISNSGCAFALSRLPVFTDSDSRKTVTAPPGVTLKCSGKPCQSFDYTSHSEADHNPIVLVAGMVAELVGGIVMLKKGSPMDPDAGLWWAGFGLLGSVAVEGYVMLGEKGAFDSSPNVTCCTLVDQVIAEKNGERILVYPTDFPNGGFSFDDSLKARLARPKDFQAPPPDLEAQRGRLAANARVAVLEFKNSALELRKDDVRYYADAVRGTALEVKPKLDVMTKENLLVLLQAQGKTLADCEGECQVDTGRRIGADAVVTGELSKVGSSYRLSL